MRRRVRARRLQPAVRLLDQVPALGPQLRLQAGRPLALGLPDQNPLDAVDPPAARKPDPRPPSPAEAARLLAEASKDPDWGALVWTTMLTGARRGELCALWREDLDLDAGVLRVSHSMKLIDKEWVRRGTKTHQHRRIALDEETIAVLREYLARVDHRAELLDLEIEPDAYLFTLSPTAPHRSSRTP